jgi:tRNA(His) 5'-end guanylyltransferase
MKFTCLIPILWTYGTIQSQAWIILFYAFINPWKVITSIWNLVFNNQNLRIGSAQCCLHTTCISLFSCRTGKINQCLYFNKKMVSITRKEEKRYLHNTNSDFLSNILFLYFYNVYQKYLWCIVHSFVKSSTTCCLHIGLYCSA